MRDDAHVLLLFRLRWLARDVLVDALMGSGVIEAGLILLQFSMEMAFAQYEEKVEAFALHRIFGQHSVHRGRVAVGHDPFIGEGRLLFTI